VFEKIEALGNIVLTITNEDLLKASGGDLQMGEFPECMIVDPNQIGTQR